MKEEIDTSAISEIVLQYIGCDNSAMLEAAWDKLGDDINVANKLEHDENLTLKYGSIATLFGE